MVNVTTAFAGTGGLSIKVGTDGDDDNFITATSVLTAGPIIVGAGAAPATLAGSFAAASDALQAKFTNSTSGSPSALTAGECDIYLAMHWPTTPVNSFCCCFGVTRGFPFLFSASPRTQQT